MTNEEWVELHREIKALEDQREVAKGATKGQLTRSLKKLVAQRRDYCRYCDSPDPGWYMFNRWQNPDGSFRWSGQPYREGSLRVWDNIIAPRYDGCSAGWVCLGCLAKREPGNRLYYEDFTAGQATVTLSDDIVYDVRFPSRRSQKCPSVRVSLEFVISERSDDEQIDVVLDDTAWLETYWAELGWRLRYAP